MRILVVTPFPPVRDGIAAYAVQSVKALTAQGHDVEVLSPGPSAAHHHLQLVGPRGAAALAKRVRAYDRVVVQFHPEFFYPLPPTPWAWAAESLALAAAFRAAREVHVVVHEIDYLDSRPHGPERAAGRLLWGAVDQIHVHTERERADFVRAFGVRPDRVRVTDHGGDFTPATRHDRASARVSLGLPPEEHVFLSIGFIQQHKGFDRAIAAFGALDELEISDGPPARLVVVGSARQGDAANVAYVDKLRAQGEQTPGVDLRIGFVSDELFDRWLVAADTVVLPYRSIWSSSVLERAALYGRDVVITDVGGLAQQAGDRDGVTVVADDDELAAALRAALGLTDRAPTGGSAAWPAPGELDESGGSDLRERVQEQVRTRAASRRRGGPVTGATPDPASLAAAAAATAPLRQLHPMANPSVASASVGAGLLKKVVRRLTAWQYDPLLHQVNALQEAAVRAVEQSAVQAGPARAVDDTRP